MGDPLYVRLLFRLSHRLFGAGFAIERAGRWVSTRAARLSNWHAGVGRD